MLSPEELLAGAALTLDVEVPAEALRPTDGSPRSGPRRVRLRPLTVRDLQIISRAAKESDSLVATLMVQRALVEPEMSVAQVAGMHIGLVQFLLQRVNEISGIAASARQLDDAVEAPLVKAAFVLAKEFGWTPEQVGELTLGQLLVNLKMLSGKSKP
ncbi:MAG: hypothetical protein HY330_01795 [Chloroflexi bacterium]|nr:hypothetical protein [Chloroflexota bacterium]